GTKHASYCQRSTHWLQNVHDLNVPIHQSPLHWIDLFAFALWHIWLRRNQQVFQNNANPPHILSLPMILMRATEFKYMTDSSITSPNRIDIKIRWFPLTTNAFKLNIDKAFYKDNQMGGIGGVIRDSHEFIKDKNNVETFARGGGYSSFLSKLYIDV
ncbi:hypothetical protein H5410_016630, partial [Solanum commersonii]